jgi:hypothetical protein
MMIFGFLIADNAVERQIMTNKKYVQFYFGTLLLLIAVIGFFTTIAS